MSTASAHETVETNKWHAEETTKLALQLQAEDLQAINKIESRPAFTVTFECPDDSSLMFVPGSLGAGVDIPTELKKRIIRWQAAGYVPGPELPERSRKPGMNLPAKYYHVLGGAFVACELVARGHSPGLIASLQRGLGWFYQAHRFHALVETQKTDPSNQPEAQDAASS